MYAKNYKSNYLTAGTANKNNRAYRPNNYQNQQVAELAASKLRAYKITDLKDISYTQVTKMPTKNRSNSYQS